MTEADTSRDNIFRMVKTFHENCPQSMRPQTRQSNEKALVFDNAEGKGLKSRYDVKTCDSKGSLGFTPQYVHLSEYPKFPNSAVETVSGLFEAVPSEHPAIIGTEMIHEGTGFGAAGAFYDAWKGAEKQIREGKEPEYIPIFVPWFFHKNYRKKINLSEKTEILKSLSTDEKWLLRQKSSTDAYITVQQLAWRRDKIENTVAPTGYTKDEYFKQWYPATADEAFLFSGKRVFPVPYVRAAERECYTPGKRGELNMLSGDFFEKNGGRLKVWERPRLGRTYVIGADVAEGNVKAGDYSCADVLSVPEGLQVAQWHGHIDPDLYGEVLSRLGIFYNTALMGVEINNHGHTVISTLKHLRYKRLYMREAIDGTGRKMKKYGWQSTLKTKPRIIDRLSGLLRDNESGIQCIETIQECDTYAIQDDGSYGAMQSCFDDRVISLAIAAEMLYQLPAIRRNRKR